MRFNGTNLRRLSCLAFAALLAASCQNPTEPGSGEASVLLNATLMQEDRFGLPAIATVFIPTAERDAYNQGTPATDRANYTDEVVARLTAFGHPNPAGLAAALLPDNSEELADVINQAGLWVKDRDEKTGNRYYQIIDHRCAKTKIGQADVARHWFVDQIGSWSMAEEEAYRAMHKELEPQRSSE